MHGRSAKTLRLSNLPLTTTPNLLDSSTFLSTDAIHVRNMFFQEFKKGAQKWIQSREHLPRICTLWPLFCNFLKSGFQNPTVLRGVSTPHMPPAKKWLFSERTNGRTDGRNIWFWLADGRKERFAQLIPWYCFYSPQYELDTNRNRTSSYKIIIIVNENAMIDILVRANITAA